MVEKSAWLKRMENGAVGEARARAFLLDRFWVLERSVDIDGADYLIQRQITKANILDRDPPRLGVLQVKFVQDEGTSIYIKKDYVVAESGHPHDEFFVLVLSGKEDEESSFLLSAHEVAACPRKKGDPEQYLITGKSLLREGKYRITSKKRALDRIEHALINADFLKNRKYIASTPYINLSPSQIEHDFLLPLDNGYADIQKTFYEMKEYLQLNTLYEMEEITGALHEILRTTDPEDAYRIFDEKISDYIPRMGTTSISVTCKAFDDEDFLTAVKNHKARLKKLRELGCVDPYFDLLKTVEGEVVSQVANLGTIGKKDIVQVTVEYDSGKLGHVSVKIARSSKSPSAVPHVVKSVAGRHVLLFKPWDWLPYEVRAGQENPPAGAEAVTATLARVPWLFKRPIQAEVDRHLLGEDLMSPFG